MANQAPVTLMTTSVEKPAQRASKYSGKISGVERLVKGQKTITRPEAETNYQKYLEKSFRQLDRVERETAAASNTKREIKESIRELGICFREFVKALRQIGMTRSADSTGQDIRVVKQLIQQQQGVSSELHQQQQKHVQHTKDTFKEIKKKQQVHSDENRQLFAKLEGIEQQIVLLNKTIVNCTNNLA